MEKIVLFGGTFDPIHNAHLHIANFVNKSLNAKVIFILAKNPRWKEPIANVNHRLAMLKLALKDNDNKDLVASTYELEQDAKINYTIDTIKYFKKIYQNKELYFLIGLDQVKAFDKWKEAKTISKLVKLIFITRPKIKINHKNIKTYHMMNLKYDKSYEVSSSNIRSFKNLDLPLPIINYIEKHNLYYIKKIKSYYKERRYVHALSVAHLAYDIAKSNNLDNLDKYYIAGLLHDVAKNINEEETLMMMKKHYPKYINDVNDKLYHQFIGEYLTKHDFEINDKDILEAIRYHASGKDKMSKLGEVIYASDKLDPLRGYNSKAMIDECLKNYHKGFLYVLVENRKYLIKNGLAINNSLTEACFKYYLGDYI